MYHNKIIGNFGENIACKYLLNKGYRIIARNYQARYREIDIVAVYGNVLVFVEVKTRTGDRYGGLENAIFGKKIRLFVKAVDYYLHLNKIRHDNFRLDYLAIDIDKQNKSAKIKHYIDFY
jgi:putative endonuclease